MTLTLKPDVTATDTEDGLVLLDQRSGRYWQLNRSGATTLRLLLDGHTPRRPLTGSPGTTPMPPAAPSRTYGHCSPPWTGPGWW